MNTIVRGYASQRFTVSSSSSYDWNIFVTNLLTSLIPPQGTVGMENVLALRAPFQVFRLVVFLVAVTMIDLWSFWRRLAEEGFGDNPMHQSPLVTESVPKVGYEVLAMKTLLDDSWAPHAPNSPEIANLVSTFVVYGRQPYFAHNAPVYHGEVG